MKQMSWMLIMVCCAFAWAPYTPADAQQRDRGRDRGARDGGTTIIHNYRDRSRPGGYGRGYGGGRHYYSGRRPGYRYEAGRGWYDPSAAIGGAIGGWLWKQWNQPTEPVRDMAWCMNRYKSYDPYTKTYLGYDGLRHGCP